MRRRAVLLGLGGVASLSLTSCGGSGDGGSQFVGDQTCNLTGGPLPTANVNLASFYQRAASFQLLSMWCWAACVSMVFAYRGHPVSQERIVSTVYGAPVNFPAIGLTIAQATNRTWVDDRGVAFSSTVQGLYDAQSGTFALTNDQIVSSLIGGTPLILGTTMHARVLVEVNYQNTPFGTQIGGGMVFDPATGTAECLSVPEMTPVNSGGALAFLAAVRVA